MQTDYNLEVTVYCAPDGRARKATIPIAAELSGKVREILSAGLRFEGELNPSLITTTITGKNADLDIVVSTDLSDRAGHRAKLEAMINRFDIAKGLSQDEEAA